MIKLNDYKWIMIPIRFNAVFYLLLKGICDCGVNILEESPILKMKQHFMLPYTSTLNKVDLSLVCKKSLF